MSPAPSVSILIPAYNERFFGQAFESARAQGYGALEIDVHDDSPGTAIEALVREARDPRVRYFRNPRRLGFGGNFTRCFECARGELVQFLNDDDRLRPQCVQSFAAVLSSNPAVTLATGRRSPIDAEGRPLAHVAPTMPLAHVSCIMRGDELGDFVLAHSMNFIGEPSAAMFRRRDLALEPGGVFVWGGREYHCLADLSLWLRLLGKGLAYYGAPALVEFRMHAGQEQERVALDCIVERLWIAREARRHGFLASPVAWAAALDRIAARVEACAPGEMGPEDRARLEDFRRELARERNDAARPAHL